MSPMGKCRHGYMSHGYMSHGYMSPNRNTLQACAERKPLSEDADNSGMEWRQKMTGGALWSAVERFDTSGV